MAVSDILNVHRFGGQIVDEVEFDSGSERIRIKLVGLFDDKLTAKLRNTFGGRDPNFLVHTQAPSRETLGMT